MDKTVRVIVPDEPVGIVHCSGGGASIDGVSLKNVTVLQFMQLGEYTITLKMEDQNA